MGRVTATGPVPKPNRNWAEAVWGERSRHAAASAAAGADQRLNMGCPVRQGVHSHAGDTRRAPHPPPLIMPIRGAPTQVANGLIPRTCALFSLPIGPRRLPPTHRGDGEWDYRPFTDRRADGECEGRMRLFSFFS